MQIIENAIGGKLTISTSDRRSPVFNPATGEQIAELPLSTVEETVSYTHLTLPTIYSV